MKATEAQIRPVLARLRITPEDMAKAGATIRGGWYECEDAAHKAMMREASARKRTAFGLGDAVAVVAQPIAKMLDLTLGTSIQNCGGCAQRREALNNLVPNIRPRI
jgi:hypothetical protein